jgi:hypothetical protein
MEDGNNTLNATGHLSCFISHAGKDDLFAQQLYDDLTERSVGCWIDDRDLVIGDRLLRRFHQEISFHSKILLILSQHSVESAWVEDEVLMAMAREKSDRTTILIPILIDDAVKKSTVSWASLIWSTRHVGDFQDWQDPKRYADSLEKLLRALKGT